MKYATIRCTNPSCKAEWEATFYADQYYLQCDGCGQMNHVPEDAVKITGRCGKCQKPWDDHPRKECKP